MTISLSRLYAGILLLLTCFFSMQISAQVTLTYANSATDTSAYFSYIDYQRPGSPWSSNQFYRGFSLNKIALPASLPDLTGGANKFWDMSSVTYIPAAGLGSSCRYADYSSCYSQPTQKAWYFDIVNSDWSPYIMAPGRKFSSINDDGIYTCCAMNNFTGFGTAHSLQQLTGNAADRVHSTQQCFGANRKQIKYPCTYGDTWTQASTGTFGMDSITVTQLNIIKKQGYFETHYTEKDSVIGWGKMKIKNMSGQVSETFDVLEIQWTATRIDSLYLGNWYPNASATPAPAALANLLGCPQGRTTKTYARFFWRPNNPYPSPCAMFFYDDATFSVVDSAYIQTAGVPILGVTQTEQLEKMDVYPNPVNNHSFTVALHNSNGDYSYDLMNTAGQNIISCKILPGTLNARIELPISVPAGTYFLSIKNKGNTIYRKALSVLQ